MDMSGVPTHPTTHASALLLLSLQGTACFFSLGAAFVKEKPYTTRAYNMDQALKEHYRTLTSHNSATLEKFCSQVGPEAEQGSKLIETSDPHLAALSGATSILTPTPGPKSQVSPDANRDPHTGTPRSDRQRHQPPRASRLHHRRAG